MRLGDTEISLAEMVVLSFSTLGLWGCLLATVWAVMAIL